MQIEYNQIKKGTILPNLKIESLAFGGKGLARYNDLVVFVSNSIPGEKVDIRVIKKKKKYIEGVVSNINSKSEYETSPECAYFGLCGGCSSQNLAYEIQLKEKYNQVKEIFKHIGKINNVPINDIIPCKEKYNYRNKMEFTFSNRKWYENPKDIKLDKALGLHIKRRFDKIVDIDRCFIQHELSNKIFSYIKNIIIENDLEPFDQRLQTGFLSNLIIRFSFSSKKTMVIFNTMGDGEKKLKPLLKPITEKFKEIASIMNRVTIKEKGKKTIVEDNILFGQDYIIEKIGDIKYRYSANSFFQTNSIQSNILFEYISKECDLTGNETVYDLYCGIGAISLYLAHNAKKVIGIEVVEDAIKDAKENVKLNKIKNADFFQGDLNNFFKKNHKIIQKNKPDVIIVDPPRAGLHKNTIDTIIKYTNCKIVYVSCNPSTQARDLVILNDAGYRIANIQPLDMFPHTPHIENIVTLIK
tara:strand:- start:4764 stop:6173 length:1410 start_codon:yes stop_codon:yes gene_type:complete